jgi:hypothetical protein
MYAPNNQGQRYQSAEKRAEIEKLIEKNKNVKIS